METTKVKTVTISFEKEILKRIEKERGRTIHSRFVNDVLRDVMRLPEPTLSGDHK